MFGSNSREYLGLVENETMSDQLPLYLGDYFLPTIPGTEISSCLQVQQIQGVCSQDSEILQVLVCIRKTFFISFSFFSFSAGLKKGFYNPNKKKLNTRHN